MSRWRELGGVVILEGDIGDFLGEISNKPEYLMEKHSRQREQHMKSHWAQSVFRVIQEWPGCLNKQNSTFFSLLTFFPYILV